ncbi:MAG TPA: methylmalonyl Co-A mutase-associated GTPase MeaB [Polyangiales bacterium]|nr:methylmalonyl Co-A mutase-associated GTPase MeaB [Polyangiales bacterium]
MPRKPDDPPPTSFEEPGVDAPAQARPIGASPRRKRLTLADYVAGVRRADRAVLGRAITLVESNARRDQDLAQQMLIELLPFTGRARRVGITGVPGVGKSTFIEALGSNLTAAGRRVAVLAVDPTSGLSGGSILGDKTRMTKLSRDANAFVRPSPASGSLGGVARKTRETMLVCEAAGFDVVLVETVGVGQSETTVAEMVDFFLVLMLANAGDELQGIKRGIMELADMIAINKAEGDNAGAARHAKREYMAALRLMRGSHPAWKPPVLAVSGLHNQGLDVLWAKIEEHRELFEHNGVLAQRRREQMRRWMWSMVDDRLLRAVRHHPEVAAQAPQLEAAVLEGKLTATLGAEAILKAFGLGSD